jgi:protein-disulfide isomerase
MRTAALTMLALLGISFTGLASAPPARAADSTLSAAQKEEVKKLVREYILENPSIISEAITALETNSEKAKVEKRAQAMVSRRQEILNPSEGTIIGNTKGDVTVVEFFDYNCGYCKQMFQSIAEVLKEDPKVRLVLKEYPILGPSSVTAAKAALAARKQGKYAEFHVALLGYKGALSDSVIMVIAQNVGLDPKKLQEDMKDPAITDILLKNHSLADDLGVDGTPQVIVEGEFLPGAVPKAQLIEAIAKARKS